MDDSWFWALSTLPQVGAALIAFIGFLVIDSMSKIDSRCQQIEAEVRTWVLREAGQPPSLVHGDPTGLGIKTMRGDRLIKEIRSSCISNANYAKRWGSGAKSWLDIWEPLNNWRENIRCYLKWFVAWNLFVMLTSLVLLPFGNALSSASAIVGVVWTATSLSVVVSTAVMVYQILIRPQP